jgi:hypothetical protein
MRKTATGVKLLPGGNLLYGKEKYESIIWGRRKGTMFVLFRFKKRKPPITGGIWDKQK